MTHRHYNTFYNSALTFAKKLTINQLDGLTPEEYATEFSTQKCIKLDAMLEEDAKQQMIDISTGRAVPTRREIATF